MSVAADTAVLEHARRTVRSALARLGDAFPGDTTHDGRWLPRRSEHGEPAGANVGWTTGFWTGITHLLTELTGDDDLAAARDRQVATFVDRVRREIGLDTHDLGFLYTLGCVQPWQSTGDERAREAALAAADHLMRRYLRQTGIFQAWGDLSDPAQRGRTIIDSLMNMPLLYWATQQTGDRHYATAARRHAEQVRERIIRADGSTFHTYYWDPVTGEPLRGATAQGHGDGSCWARGQAWGMYGFALNHRHTGDPSLLRAACTVADYFIDHLPGDLIPYWDLDFDEGSGQERDTSSAAIAVRGLDEICAALPDGPARAGYAAIADSLLDALGTGWTSAGTDADGILLHGVYNKPEGDGVDEATLWGDYYYLEAVVSRIRPDRPSAW